MRGQTKISTLNPASFKQNLIDTFNDKVQYVL